jgi:peroxiredoxin Q/BCP
VNGGHLDFKEQTMRAGKFLVAAMMVGATSLAAQGTQPAVGTTAPDFTLPGATSAGVLPKPLQLSSLRGRTVVLAFFPKARTSGCTVQMKTYRDQYATLFGGGKDVTLLAISADADSTLASWAKDEAFPFTFLSDVGGTVGKLYGAFNPKWSMDNRILFVIAPDGKISYVASPFREVDPTSYTLLGAELKKATAAKS